MTLDIETTLLDSYASVLSYVRQKVDADHAEDITQTVFLRAFGAMRRGHGSTEHPTGWLWKIVKNVIIDHWRSRGREPEWLDIDTRWDDDGDSGSLGRELVASDDLSPFEVCERCRIVEQVRGAVERLPSAKQTDAMHLMLDGYDNREIAAMLQMNDKAVRQTHVRARRSLREWLVSA